MSESAVVADRDLHALVSLLESEDGRSIALLVEQMRSFPEIRLRRLAELAPPDSGALDYVDLVLVEHQAPRLEAELRRWRQGNQDLETAMDLIARMRYPRLAHGELSRRLNGLAGEIADRIPRDDSTRRLKALTYCMHNVLGFHGNPNDYYNPDNSYLTRVIELRRGLPISLTVVYILLGKRLGLDIGGIGLPGHFIASMPSSPSAIYFDPSMDGATLRLNEVMRLVTGANYVFHPEQLRRATALQIVQRSLTNLENAYERRHDVERAASIQQFRMAL
jgi:regulator of sirC expression with transglutaminase-like and TPR domain